MILCSAVFLHFCSASVAFLPAWFWWSLRVTLGRYASLIVQVSDQTGLAFTVYNDTCLYLALKAEYVHR